MVRQQTAQGRLLRRQTGGEEITPPRSASATIQSVSNPSAALRRELRKRVRVDAIIPTTYRLETPGASTGQTVTRNLSLGGAQIFLPERLPIGTPVTLTLRLPQVGEVSPRGRVMWQGRRFYTVEEGRRVVSTGIQFETPTSLIEERISAFIDRMLWRDHTSAISKILQRLARLPSTLRRDQRA